MKLVQILGKKENNASAKEDPGGKQLIRVVVQWGLTIASLCESKVFQAAYYKPGHGSILWPYISTMEIDWMKSLIFELNELWFTL